MPRSEEDRPLSESHHAEVAELVPIARRIARRRAFRWVEDAEEVAMSALCRAVSVWHSEPERRKNYKTIERWVWGRMRTALYNAGRRQARRKPALYDPVVLTEKTDNERAEKTNRKRRESQPGELEALLWDSVAKLPPRIQKVIHALKGGATTKAIAAQGGCSEQTARRWVAEARKAVEVILGLREDFSPDDERNPGVDELLPVEGCISHDPPSGGEQSKDSDGVAG